MKQQLTCIVCPNSCLLEAEVENGQVSHITGNLCPQGAKHLVQELTNPYRTLSTSIIVYGGELPLASVRLDRPVPKACLSYVMDALNKIHVQAPVTLGQIAVENILGLGCNVIFTRNVDCAKH